MDNLMTKLEDDFAAISGALVALNDDMNNMAKVISWFLNGNTGISSKTIVSAMLGLKYNDAHTPRDPADFKRCSDLLKIAWPWRRNLQKVADTYPKWQPLVDNWDELEGLLDMAIDSGKENAPELYERIQELTSGNILYATYFLQDQSGKEEGPFVNEDAAETERPVLAAKLDCAEYKINIVRRTFTKNELFKRKYNNITKYHHLEEIVYE